MVPYFHDAWLTVWQGDSREVLRDLPESSVHLVVTSPPYYSLRSYLPVDHPDKAKEIGREQTPNEYVEALVTVFRDVRRVLRSDGLLFLNLGDSYAAERGGTPMPAETIAGGIGGRGDEESHRGRGDEFQPHRKASAYGLKHKDLMLMPARVALALQADGWWLRNDIVWSTPNPMPESVKDRFTNSYEHVFMLAKSANYFFDQDAVREPNSAVTLNRIQYGLNQRHPDDQGVGIPPVNTTTVEDADDFGKAVVTKGVMGDRFANPLGRNRRDVWTIPTKSYSGAHYAVMPEKLVEPMILAGTSERGVCPECGAPWRRVTERVGAMAWSPTCAHDNTRELRECPECDEPYREIDAVDPWLALVNPGRAQSVRAVEMAQERGLTLQHIEALRAAGITDTGKSQQTQTGWLNNTAEVQRLATEAKLALGSYVREFTFLPSRTVGWEPTCSHEASQTVPAVVLDPFAGSGTVGKVAQDHNRRAVLIDLNAEYLGQQLTRNAQIPLGLGVD